MTMRHLVLPLFAALSLAAVPALAGQPLVVEKNHTYRIGLSAAAGSVVVGNPDIADVTVVDSRTVFIVARGVGTSGITITDRAGHTLYDAEVTVTSASAGAITVYRGLTPSLMVCSTVCVTQEANVATIGAAPQPSGPAPTTISQAPSPGMLP
jgi:Flp pilus assembly secretin CpaC